MNKISFGDIVSRFFGSTLITWIDMIPLFFFAWTANYSQKRDLKRFSISVSFLLLLWLIVLESNQNHTLLAGLDSFKNSKSWINSKFKSFFLQLLTESYMYFDK